MLALRLTLTETKYRENYQGAVFYRQVLERLNALPGVQSAVAVTALPYSGHSSGRAFTIEGKPVERGSQPDCMHQVISPRYFETLHIPLIGGRLLNACDGADSPRVGVISDRMARRFWPNESPIGKRIKLGSQDSKSPWITIAGVVGDAMHGPYDRSPHATLYVPFEQLPGRWMDIGVRVTGDPLRLAPAVTAVIRSIDAEQPITRMTTLETWMQEQSVGLNYMAVLMGVFGALALVLSSVGIYGVMAYVVAEQTQEIGIRVALGAGRASVLGMVYRRGAVMVAAGLAIGLVLAYGFSRPIASLIHGVSASDPPTFIGIPLTLIASAAVAIYIPARRAMRIDPIVALSCE
jgi:putative ABC transport system permease protein